jgi:hypothetical protein
MRTEVKTLVSVLVLEVELKLSIGTTATIYTGTVQGYISCYRLSVVVWAMEKFNMFPKKKHYLLKIFRCVNNFIQDTTDVHIIGGELARASIFQLRDREFDSRRGLMILM